MTRYGMVIDINSCVGCYNCQLACKDEYVGNDWLPFSKAQPDLGQLWMKIVEQERDIPFAPKVQYTPTLCQGCKDAPCVSASKDGAVYTRPDGIVIIDPVKAKGQKQVVAACPYDVIYWNEEKGTPEMGGLAQKCTFCAHLLDSGEKTTRCAESCPTDAIIFGDMDDSNSRVSQLVKSGATETLHPEFKLDTAVRYIGLPKPLISGSVIFGDSDECGSDVSITLVDGSAEQRTKTNTFGDFVINNVTKGRDYAVKFEHPGYQSKTVQVKTDMDTNLGQIILQK